VRHVLPKAAYRSLKDNKTKERSMTAQHTASANLADSTFAELAIPADIGITRQEPSVKNLLTKEVGNCVEVSTSKGAFIGRVVEVTGDPHAPTIVLKEQMEEKSEFTPTKKEGWQWEQTIKLQDTGKTHIVNFSNVENITLGLQDERIGYRRGAPPPMASSQARPYPAWSEYGTDWSNEQTAIAHKPNTALAAKDLVPNIGK
jgi:hypothetical protein